MKQTLTKFFYSDQLNINKYNLLYNKGVILRGIRQSISDLVFATLNDFIENQPSKYEFRNSFYAIHKGTKGVSSNDIANSIVDVYMSYDKCVNEIRKSIFAKTSGVYKTTFYKRQTKKNKKGDIKSQTIKYSSSQFSIAMTHLIRYGFIGIHKHIKSKLDNNEYSKEKTTYYENILRCLDKYGEDRLLSLAIRIRNRTFKKKINQPIQYNSLTFSSITNIPDNILEYNDNPLSIINAFITLGNCYSNERRKRFHIPVSYSKKYHGSIKNYVWTGKRNCTAYQIMFLPNNRIKINLYTNQEVTMPFNKKSFIGVDVNVKHNLFATSTDHIIDFDRKMVSNYVRFIKKLDKKRSIKTTNNQDTCLSNRDQRTFDKCKLRLKNMLKEKCSELVKHAISKGKNHIVLENLLLHLKSFCITDEFDGIKYSRLIRLLNLSDLKNHITTIAHKKGLCVSFVNSEFTSTECSKCGHIDSNNRKTQKVFCCTNCNFTINADKNAALVIENRISQDVLVEKLLSVNKAGEYTCRKLSHEHIKSVLLSYVHNPLSPIDKGIAVQH